MPTLRKRKGSLLMKRIIIPTKPEQQPVLELDQCGLKSYYGVLCIEPFKAFITRSNYDCENFKVYACSSLTNGNGLSYHTSETLTGCIRSLLDAGYFVFAFDTPQELFTRLAED